VFVSRQERSEGAGPCATSSCEPRQVRKEATVSRSVCVPQDHLAPLFIKMLKQVHQLRSPLKGILDVPRGQSRSWPAQGRAGENGRYASGFFSVAASLGKGRLLASLGWVGVIADLFEHFEDRSYRLTNND
jgi:hypothetical protein